MMVLDFPRAIFIYSVKIELNNAAILVVFDEFLSLALTTFPSIKALTTNRSEKQNERIAENLMRLI
uniref:Red protein n=1 Tax=Rhizophora mucronata TaxID=61149 RepID=A0A2P2L635_RHIMU